MNSLCNLCLITQGNKALVVKKGLYGHPVEEYVCMYMLFKKKNKLRKKKKVRESR